MPVLPLIFICLFLAAGPCLAQTPAQMTLSQAESMPSWTVPVLRLVSATHVEPTTGVVISDSGLVMVPADFATIGDEIIVLDGGTDIIRNGRPATITHRFREEGLQVLSVTGLRRTGAGFSAAPLKDGDEIRLSAFPPAEMIAEGAAPLDITTAVAVPDASTRAIIAGQTQLPNVTGPLLDDCGNLVGYSMASGVQSMSTTESPAYLWKQTLNRLMREIQLEPRISDCSQGVGVPAETADKTADEFNPPETEDSAPEPDAEPVEEPTQENVDSEPEVQDEAEDTAQEQAENSLPPEQEEVAGEKALEEMEMLPPFEDDPGLASEAVKPESPSAEDSGAPGWLWLVAAILLIGAGLVLHRYRSRAGDQAEETAQPAKLQPAAVDEQETEAGDTSASLDSRLVISGLLGDGTPFEIGCEVSRQAINLVVGRSHSDLVIDSPAVSRHHASLNGTGESLTISDLGSSNGTSINGVPCLEGETMFIKQGDTIVLGNVRFSYEIRADSAADEQARE
jgi:predicted component of type VI protein secretion system